MGGHDPKCATFRALPENGLAHCRETIPYKEAMRLAPDEGRFPSASGYGLIAKELSDAFAA